MNRKKLPLLLLLIISLFTFSGCRNIETPPNDLEASNDALQNQQQNGTQEQQREQLQQEEDSTKEEEDKEDLTEASNTSGTSAEEVKQEDSKKEDTKQENSSEGNETNSEGTEKLANTENNDESSLRIEGKGIDKPLTLSLDTLKEMKDFHFEDDFFSLNSYGTEEYFHFKGIKIKALLEKAGLKEEAKIVNFVASDGYEVQLTIEEALKEDYIDEQDSSKQYPVIIAWHENGKDYNSEKGLPFRLVIGQIEAGDVNKPQWVQNIAKIIVD